MTAIIPGAIVHLAAGAAGGRRLRRRLEQRLMQQNECASVQIVHYRIVVIAESISDADLARIESALRLADFEDQLDDAEHGLACAHPDTSL